MKNFLSCFLFVLVTWPLITSAQNHKRVEVIFDSSYDLRKVLHLKDSLAKYHQIKIDYSQLSFDINGKLQSINFSVNSNDGFKGSARTSNLNKPLPFGFIRDYPNKKVPFIVGFLK